MALNAETLWSRVSDFLVKATGLYFPQNRWTDMVRALGRMAEELELKDAVACGQWLLQTPLTKVQFQVLVDHLTIGETYFFRDRKALDILTGNVIPKLIQARRNGSRTLRLWSAACCTGEEPYSLAILLRQILPDIKDWNVKILATDLNTRFLKKAAAGEYGTWSFRDSPPGYRERYFRQTGDARFTILPEIRAMVDFRPLNFVEDHYPSPLNETGSMDVILCRNVLIYFNTDLVSTVIERLRRCLVDGGWLVVSPSEVSQELFSKFTTHNFPGVIIYQRDDSHRPIRHEFVPEPPVIEDPVVPFAWALPEPELTEEVVVEEALSPVEQARALHHAGRFSETAELLLQAGDDVLASAEACSLLARALADQGKLDDALEWCDRAIAADKLDAGAHYLRAIILTERDLAGPARESLQRAIYLQPDFVLAHFALGNLTRGQGKKEEAGRHFANALRLLQKHRAEDLLGESDGLTAGRLIEIITAMTARGSTV